MKPTVLAYLAGAMDSDGYFSIKKSTYHIRVRKDATNPVYSENIGLKQVTPYIPDLLKECFGASRLNQKASTENGKPLHGWQATALIAARCTEDLLPYLRVKRRQAELLLELRKSRGAGYWQVAHWFVIEYPDWQSLEMLTTQETMDLLGHTNRGSIGQAVSNGTLLALPYHGDGRWRGEQPRYPRLLVERIAKLQGRDGRALIQAPELVAWRERLWQEVRELNRIGTGLHPITERTGPYTQAAV